ncbi:protein-disulfide reductase DsbD domain-containing protein [Pseudoponticoccus marisrubri]|uniref:Thiol:disulfide interchange protein DsbD N-terminal domain-containing protein n=1 Tax=Pseudoponticoccus marisrubri TaxID=1685382 RepID=A0A0W7WGL5_9RHOB|nr:protein-disulfide reductase DsbD domain-containing protein [Pseudoponticoccus marisrubri]KUF09745.1 hypothetical protein AVJ23_16470 [Pseudoponticoccus marisrubri]
MTRILALLLGLAVPGTALSGPYDDVISAELRPGWRLPDGDHMAALHMVLAPGWKTYWRSPGEAGIPPVFDWSGARNTGAVRVQWPAPDVFWQSGMRSVGYRDEVVLPLRVSLKNSSRDARLAGVVDIGICHDVCMPHRLQVEAVLPADATRPDPVIAASLADLPFGREDGGVSAMRCRVSPASDGGLAVRVELDMPRGTGREETVIEFPDPQLWVTEPQTYWQDGDLVAEAHVSHASGGAFALSRGALQVTVLNGRLPLEIRGCDG